MITPPAPKKGPFEWHKQQMELLRKWAEIASCYRWMHNQAYMIYRKKNLNFMIPLIVMSTVTGTANFAQSSFPEVIRPNVPQINRSISFRVIFTQSAPELSRSLTGIFNSVVIFLASLP